MHKSKQVIKCDVNNCEYNDITDCMCTLDSINVSCTCNSDSCKNKKETICNSFKENGK